MKVLVFGSLNIDLIFSVDHIVRGGETISSTGFKRSAGGKGANQAAALAKAGLKTFMAGKIGADGAFLREILESYKVNTSYVLNYEGATGQAIIQLDKNRQNAIVLFAGGNDAIDAAQVDATLAGFGEGDYIVLQNEISVSAQILEKAKERKMRIVLNPSPYDRRIDQFSLNMVDMLFVNEIEGAELAGLALDSPRPAVLDALAARFPRCEIVLTAGKEGAYYGFGADRAKAGIVDAPVIDTTAAGDTFLGFFLAARTRGFSPEAALAASCKASSITVSRSGAMESIPFAAEVF
jgi:ribokinase